VSKLIWKDNSSKQDMQVSKLEVKQAQLKAIIQITKDEWR
jgi:hypothetical protein